MKSYFEADLVVVGGGPAGFAAALSAARHGVDVLLLESNGSLGGMSTVGGVHPFMTFHTKDGQQTVKGIGEELIQRLVSMNASRGHVRDTMGETLTVTPFDPETLKDVMSQMLREANVRILLHTFVFDVLTDGDRIEALRAANKNGEVIIRGKFFVDGTGDADVAFFSGCETEKGENNNGQVQPCSMLFSMANVDFEKVREYMLAHPEEFHFRTDFDLLKTELPNSVSGFFSLWKQTQDEIDVEIRRDRFLFFRGYRDDIATVNTTRITGVDSTDAEALSDAEILGKHQALAVAKKMIEHLPGFENAYLMNIAGTLGIRESRRIVGEYILTLEDLQEGRRFDDEVCLFAYPVDRHDPTGSGFNEFAVPMYGIPYRCMIPKKMTNLLVSGRSLSCDVMALSSVRLTPCCMAMGQSAGIAIALCLQNGLSDVRDVDAVKMRELLLEDKAYL